MTTNPSSATGIDPPDPQERLHALLRETSSRLLDAQSGYSQAAAQVATDDLRALFRHNAEMRDAFGAQIAELRAKHEEFSSERTTTGGAAHLLWNSLREVVGANDRIRIIGECERWEEVVVREYEALLEEAVVPPAIKDVLRSQKDKIEVEIDKLRKLRRDREEEVSSND